MRGRPAVILSLFALAAIGILLMVIPRPDNQPMGKSVVVPVILLESDAGRPTEEERRQIDRLIDRLAEIENPDYGFAPFLSGNQFAPIKGSSTFGAGMIMIDHGLKTSDCVERLVALGPKALPQLLERLTDETPTRLAMEHGGGFGGQWYDHEIPMNLGNPVEQRVSDAYPEYLDQRPLTIETHIDKHQITIGDVCFAIVGQIVNRGYQSVRYQPTACRVINSPTHDPQIAAVVREMWTSDHPAQTLLDSLLRDYYSADTDGMKCGAALRLLFYFPEQMTQRIVRRIESFDLTRVIDGEDWERKYAKDGVAINEFLQAVAPIESTEITSALLRVVRKAEEPAYVFSAITGAVVNCAPNLVFQRLQEMVSVPPEPDGGIYGLGYAALTSAVRHFPDKSRELFEIYRRHPLSDASISAIQVLKDADAPRPWIKDFLASLLDDRTETGWSYGPDNNRYPLRVCDEAAEVLSCGYLQGTSFEMEGGADHLDGEIAKLKRALAR